MWWIIAVVAVVILIAVVVIRTIRFKPTKVTQLQATEENVNEDRIISNMQKMIRCKTISYLDRSLEDDAEFEKFYHILDTEYPLLNKTLTKQKLGVRGLLYHWKGENEGNATIFMSHFDVVPVLESAWKKPAFEAIIENGEMWGRGTLDTKGTLCSILESVEELIGRGFVPKHDIYLSFGGDEETRGESTPYIVEYFEKNNIEIGMVLDEGGAVVSGVFPTVKKSIAVVGTSEKGIMDLHFDMKSEGGHASTPPKHTIVGELAKAIRKMENYNFKMKLSGAGLEMLETLAKEAIFPIRMVFANLWLFSPILSFATRLMGGDLNAIVRTTFAATMMKGSDASNVIPPSASMIANLRLITGDTVESVVETAKKVVNNDKISIYASDYFNPSRNSDTSCEGYKLLQETIMETWQNTIPSPYLMLGCSDSRHYARISDKVFRFSPMEMSKEERGYIHGHNERISIENLKKTVVFFIRMMKKC